MTGLFFNFEENDIVIGSNGSFVTSDIDGQCCTLIAISQICRITKPEVGTQLISKMYNRRYRNVAGSIAEAKRAVEKDGGKNVVIDLIDDNIYFDATYEN